MIEVAAALSAATTAFNAIKKGFEVGRDIESMSNDLGRWMGSVSDINKADEYAKNPPLLLPVGTEGLPTAEPKHRRRQRQSIHPLSQ